MLLLNITFGHHFWTSLFDITLEYSIGRSLLNVALGHHFWTTFWISVQDFTLGYHFWTSLLNVTFECQIRPAAKKPQWKKNIEKITRALGIATDITNYRLNWPRCQFSENIKSHIIKSPGEAGAVLRTPSLLFEYFILFLPIFITS